MHLNEQDRRLVILAVLSTIFLLNDYLFMMARSVASWLMIDYGSRLLAMGIVFYLIRHKTSTLAEFGLKSIPLRSGLFWMLLLTVTGVGPKVAMAIVGSRPTADLQLAILQQDQAVLVSIPGIGKKLAERIIFELKEKVSAAGVAAGSSAAFSTASEGEVVAALQALGYSLGEAREASRLAVSDPAVGAGLEDRVKAALRTLLRD